MIVSYSYRGVKTVLHDEFNPASRDVKGNLHFKSCYNGNKKQFNVVIEPYELLITAQKCIQQLNQIASTSYKIYS